MRMNRWNSNKNLSALRSRSVCDPVPSPPLPRVPSQVESNRQRLTRSRNVLHWARRVWVQLNNVQIVNDDDDQSRHYTILYIFYTYSFAETNWAIRQRLCYAIVVGDNSQSKGEEKVVVVVNDDALSGAVPFPYLDDASCDAQKKQNALLPNCYRSEQTKPLPPLNCVFVYVPPPPPLISLPTSPPPRYCNVC